MVSEIGEKKKMGAICSTAQPAPKKRETKFDVTKSPPGSPSLNHKASLKGWLDGLDVRRKRRSSTYREYYFFEKKLDFGSNNKN